MDEWINKQGSLCQATVRLRFAAPGYYKLIYICMVMTNRDWWFLKSFWCLATKKSLEEANFEWGTNEITVMTMFRWVVTQISVSYGLFLLLGKASGDPCRFACTGLLFCGILCRLGRWFFLHWLLWDLHLEWWNFDLRNIRAPLPQYRLENWFQKSF